MLRKSYLGNGKTCRVTFTVPRDVGARRAQLCGEFNDWDVASHPLKGRKDGRLSTSLSLRTGRSYRFRYLLDGSRWMNDGEADDHVPNPFGSEDSVVRI